METFAFAVIGLLLLTGGVVVYRLWKNNSSLCSKMVEFESKILQVVEERLLCHTKYCERLDKLVQEQLGDEEQKWRELLQASARRIKDQIAKANKEAVAKSEDDLTALTELLEKQKMNFKALLDQAYLEEYEKMRRSPPRPKKGPRKKIEPPQRFRSLDDEFNYNPPEATK